MDIVKLRELLEAELSSEEPVRLDSEFYHDFRSLIKAYEASAESSKSRGETIEERLYLEQIRIAESLMREIIRLRLHKIVELAFKGVPVDLPPEEREILLTIRSFIEGDSKGSVQAMPESRTGGGAGEEQEKPAEVPAGSPVTHAYIVTVDLPAVMGPDMVEYGPLRSGDMVVLPDEIGRVLLERKAAFRISLRLGA
ncbi:MAG: hypothetical protein GXO14_01255 [Thermococci archaeon]|nr:hypothetical protein [Thermococci archaeon]